MTPGTMIHANFTFGKHYAVVSEDRGGSLEVHPVTSRKWPEEIHPTVRIEPNEGLPFSRTSFIQVNTETISKDLVDNEFGPLPEKYFERLQEVR
ncbi:MAG: hypothetical protein CMA14_01430 [Euryarchaeota archaeon]|nr:hypothetical protein [Euryarchaeota archaeon]OUW79282.1 MAG: hypothetical protein CBD75_01180 [Euryarchaeota archaeon TMED215]|tara:strand:- start:206 stop:487 length:282 start_codon:yes stop_codon:yes gene_type:complete